MEEEELNTEETLEEQDALHEEEELTEEESDEQAEEVDNEPEEEATDKEDNQEVLKKKPKRNSASKRLNRMRYRLGEKDREIEALKAKLEESPKQEIKKPKEDDFNSYSDYEKANEGYIKEKAKEEARNEWQEEEQKRELARAQREQQRAWRRKQEEATEKYKDYPQVEQDFKEELQDLQEIDPQNTKYLLDEVIDSDLSTEIVYFLGKNPKELDRFLDVEPKLIPRDRDWETFCVLRVYLL